MFFLFSPLHAGRKRRTLRSRGFRRPRNNRSRVDCTKTLDRTPAVGVEVDLAYTLADGLTAYTNVAWNDGEYENFVNGPCPLELIGTGTAACDLSGQALPGLSSWAIATGGEYSHELNLFGFAGEAFVGLEAFRRSQFSSDAANSRYMEIDGYATANLRVGFRTASNAEIVFWSTNLFDEEYLLITTAQSGNSGLVTGTPADARAIGATFRLSI